MNLIQNPTRSCKQNFSLYVTQNILSTLNLLHFPVMFYKYYFFNFHKMKFQFYFTFLYKMISNNFIRQGNTNWNLERKYIYRHFVYFIKFLGTSLFSISLVYLQKQTFTRLKFHLCTTCPTFLEFFKFDVDLILFSC